MDELMRKVLIRDNVPVATYVFLIFAGMLLDTLHVTNGGAVVGAVLGVISLWVSYALLNRWWPSERYQEAKTASKQIVQARAVATFGWALAVAGAWTTLFALERHLDGQGPWSDCWSWPWFFLVLGIGSLIALITWIWGMLSLRHQSAHKEVSA